MTTTKFSFLKRSPTLTADEFSYYWRVPHVKALVEDGGHRDYNKSYVQNLVLNCALENGGMSFDGVAQMAIRERDPSAQRFQDDPRYMRSVRPDEERFLDVNKCVVAYSESKLVLAPPPDAAHKLMLMHGHGETNDRSAFTNLRQEVEARVRAGMTHHLIDRCRLTRMSDGAPMQWQYAAITELVVQDPDSIKQLMESIQAWRSKLPSNKNDRSPPQFLAAYERIIYSDSSV